jgi:hypothetical protein
MGLSLTRDNRGLLARLVGAPPLSWRQSHFWRPEQVEVAALKSPAMDRDTDPRAPEPNTPLCEKSLSAPTHSGIASSVPFRETERAPMFSPNRVGVEIERSEKWRCVCD